MTTTPEFTTTPRDPDAIKADCELVTARIKANREKIRKNGPPMRPEEFQYTTEQIGRDRVVLDGFLGELSGAMARHNPDLLAY